MIRLAEARKKSEPKAAKRTTFITGTIQDVKIPRIPYALITSTSLLHHLHDPHVLWNTLVDQATEKTIIYIVDLLRPPNEEEALKLVNTYSGNEPEILKQDFFNSLCAAFEPDEVREQLSQKGLNRLSVKVVSDRHFIVYGKT